MMECRFIQQQFRSILVLQRLLYADESRYGHGIMRCPGPLPGRFPVIIELQALC